MTEYYVEGKIRIKSDDKFSVVPIEKFSQKIDGEEYILLIPTVLKGEVITTMIIKSRKYFTVNSKSKKGFIALLHQIAISEKIAKIICDEKLKIVDFEFPIKQ